MTERKPKAVIVALDFASERETWNLVERLDPATCRLKVGKELFTRCGPGLVTKLVDLRFDVFLDLKFHDIPNTVAAACAAAADLGCWMVNVHAAGGRAMLTAAAERLAKCREKPLLIAVTVLTSMDDAALAEVGFSGDTNTQVRRLAKLGHACGVDGVVCSAHELRTIKDACGTGFLAVTPGVRPPSAALDDQRRVATPVDAMTLGADYLVIGRPITRAADPFAVLEAINAELSLLPVTRR